jgi:O-succinylbenzoic acid--CoA ligase
MARLVALALPGGPGFVEALRRAWDAGDAVLPVDLRLPPPARAALLAALRPAVLVTPAGVEDLPDALPVQPGDALVVATSGTTGEPKGAVLTHDAVRASAVASSDALAVDPSTDRWLACLPLAHVGGLGVVTRALCTGTPLEVHDRFDPAAVVDAADRGATLVSLVATALARIDPSRFRRILLGGGPAPEDRPPNAVTTYGMTETGSGIVYDGRPLQGVQLRVVDGELHVRCPMLLRAYRDGTDPKDADGWFPTGDLGAVGPDGTVQVFGRRSELIITGGENVWPAAVERVLAEVPGVADVAVVGRPDPEWGRRVTALVVPTDPAAPPTLEDLRAAVKAVLPAHAAPRSLELVDAIPRTALGKIRRPVP